MLHEALSLRDRRRLDRGKGPAMSVAVSSGDWMDPVEDALRRAHAWKHAFKRSGASRTSDRPEVGNDTCADVLGSGFSVLGVSTSPERFLPSALTAVADIRIALGNPSPTSVRRAIHLVTGRPLGRLPDGVARGLTPMEVAACIRAGSSPAACVRRLQAASATKVCEAQVGLGDVPVLAETFAYGQAQEWGLRLVSAIEEYRRGERSWASIEDRNIVLAGDAGTGKSTFARSLAKSAGTPIVPTSVSTWFASTGGYLNDIVKAIDAVFARAAAFGGPVVILIDETDGIPNRATVDSRHRDYWVPIISHLLLQLDSAISGANNQFIVIGATNFPERLDEALVRPGRLNRIVHIRRPDVPATAGILRQHLGDALPDADLMPLAHIGHGATGAEIAGWARGARMIARQAGREMVLDDLVDQVAPPETRSPELLLAISRHEASHAAATLKLGLGTVTTVSVVARGAYAGRTSARLHDASSMTAGELDALVVSILAGRAADQHWGRSPQGRPADGARISRMRPRSWPASTVHGSSENRWCTWATRWTPLPTPGRTPPSRRRCSQTWSASTASPETSCGRMKRPSTGWRIGSSSVAFSAGTRSSRSSGPRTKARAPRPGPLALSARPDGECAVMDERLLALLGTLAEIERELGREVYDNAVERMRVALAHECLVEAERRALRTRSEVAGCPGLGTVIRFPGVGPTREPISTQRSPAAARWDSHVPSRICG